MIDPRPALSFFLACIVGVGCGRREAAAPVAPEPDPQPAATSPAALPPADPDPDPEPEPVVESAPAISAVKVGAPLGGAEVEEALAEARRLIEDASFGDAMGVLREARTRAAGTARSHEVGELLRETMGMARESMEVGFAIDNLASDTPRIASGARRVLLQSSRTGRILLRKAVRDREDVAVPVVRILGDLGDTNAVPALAARLFAPVCPPELADALADALVHMPQAVPAVALSNAVERLLVDTGAVAVASARLLGAARGVLEDDAALATAAGHPAAPWILREALRGWLDATPAGESAWIHEAMSGSAMLSGGLMGEYYEGIDFQTRLTTRLDARIELPDGVYPPDGRRENVSVRWTGNLIVPASATYTFTSESDDGQRLWINGQLLIDDWNMHGVEARTAAIALSAGSHTIRVEHMQATGPAFYRLSWEGGGVARQVLAAPYVQAKPTMQAASTRLTAALAPPDMAMLEGLQQRAHSPFVRAAVDRELLARVDETSPAWAARMDAWFTRGESDAERRQAMVLLSALHSRPCAYDHAAFDARVGREGAAESLVARAEQAAAAGQEDKAAFALSLGLLTVPGLRGSYFAGTEFEKLVFERRDARVRIGNLGYRYPDGRVEQLSIRWEGDWVVTEDGEYTLYSVSDDGQRLWVRGDLVIDNWVMQGPTEMQAKVALRAGPHPLRIEYMQGGGGGEIAVSWSKGADERRPLEAPHVRTRPWAGMDPQVGAPPFAH